MSKEEKRNKGNEGVSRRGFLGAVGAGSIAIAAAKGAQAAGEQNIDQEQLTQISLNINGRNHKVFVESRYTLLFVIRDLLGMVATKVGCERGECGACTVLIDGKTRYACMTLAVEAVGHEITTLEGLMDGEELGTVQKAFAEEDAFQCGFCTPGQVVAMEGMLRENPGPSDEEIRQGMSGNICRCGTYKHIFNAAKNASEKIKNGGEK